MSVDFKIVKLDETHYWDLPKDCGIKKIWGIYLSDFSRNHFCCEITPSKLLEFLDYDVEFEDELYDVENSDRREELYCEFIDNADTEIYIYRHSSSLLNPGEGVEVEDVEWLDASVFCQDYDLEDFDGYTDMLSEAWQHVKDSDCYW